MQLFGRSNPKLVVLRQHTVKPGRSRTLGANNDKVWSNCLHFLAQNRIPIQIILSAPKELLSKTWFHSAWRWRHDFLGARLSSWTGFWQDTRRNSPANAEGQHQQALVKERNVPIGSPFIPAVARRYCLNEEEYLNQKTSLDKLRRKLDDFIGALDSYKEKRNASPAPKKAVDDEEAKLKRIRHLKRP